jgi:uncharacterized RDD family membrane protein YckC
MKITCPSCNFSKEVDPEKLPGRTIRATCPRCKTAFTIEKPDPGSFEQPLPNGPQVYCPGCGFEQPQTSYCRSCGVEMSPQRESSETEEQQDPQQAAFQNELTRLRSIASAQTSEFQPKAGFWIRVVAAILDSFLLSAVQFALTFIITMSIDAMDMAALEDPAISFVIWLFGMTISLGYAVFFTGYCGQTPGKMALRIKVVRTDGDPMTYGRAAKREILGKFVSSLLLGIGYLMVAFDKQKQGLHDKIADTYVVKL